jgi:hypothetical protein
MLTRQPISVPVRTPDAHRLRNGVANKVLREIICNKISVRFGSGFETINTDPYVFLVSNFVAMNSYFSQETGVEMELEENMPLLEWLANNYKTFGAQLEIITDRWVSGSV